jgi:hypothetical protein
LLQRLAHTHQQQRSNDSGGKDAQTELQLVAHLQLLSRPSLPPLASL